ncbi:hypothetical protein RUM44_004488 [Polyplax serrata]|uniref:ILEI/PANDER domain-containing protein n=1 Tax=Polyplax serrata TaxID=468196 RepID=A0ABR1B2Z2_POLSC
MTQNWVLVFLLGAIVTVANWEHLFEFIQGREDFSLSSSNAFREIIQVFDTEPNCGLRQECPANSFSIFLSTGLPLVSKPSLCINGKHLMKPLVNGDGRGINAAVMESKYFQVLSFRNFDTYLSNKSSEILNWLDGISDGDIVVMFTHDEAASKLDGETKSLINELGSGKIQNLQYRSQWYMISQKGTKGFTVYEKITYSKRKTWGDKIEFRGCVPRNIPKKITTADEPLKENRKKAQFCKEKQDDKYKGFCNEARFEIIMPALLTNKSLFGNEVFSVPIYIFASKNLEVMISALDSLIHQPGIVPSLITILYESESSDVVGLSRIYDVNSNKTKKFAASFEKKLLQIRGIAEKSYPTKRHLIVIDSEVIPSPDFLFFIAQLLPIVQKDDEVSTISCWSPNCYETEGGVHLAYRIRGVPRFAALISSVGEDHFYQEMFAPDVSRIQGPETCHMPSLEPDNWIERPQDLLKNRYFHKLIMLQQLSQVVEVDEVLSSCSDSSIKYDTNAIYVPFDYETLSKLLKCLGIQNEHYGESDGIIRLYIRGKNVLVITSNSSFYKSRPIVTA